MRYLCARILVLLLVLSEMANNNKIERAAVRAVEAYIDKCPKLEPIISKNDKTPMYDGGIYAYNNRNHKIENYFATVPVQVKGTTADINKPYRINRNYLDGFKKDRGCIFYLVYVAEETLESKKVLYAMLTTDDLDQLLKQTAKTIKIDLKEVPDDSQKFESDLFTFAAMRNDEKTEISSPKEIEDLVKGFEKIRGYLGEIEVKETRYELESLLDSIKNTKDDGTIGWRDKFIYYSRKALDLFTNNFQGHNFAYLQHNFGLYLFKQKQYHLVENYYLKALAENRKRKDIENVAIALNNLGELHRVLTRYEDAEQEYQEALNIRRELANIFHGSYIKNVADTINNLAIIHATLNRHELAEEEWMEALEIYRDLAEANREVYIVDVAQTLNNLAVLHDNVTRYEKAEKELMESLEVYRELTQKNRDAFIGDVAIALHNLAASHDNLNRKEEAEQEYLEALEIRRGLAMKNRDAYIADVAMTLNNLGNLHGDLNRKKEAEQEYLEALEIRRDLAKKNRNAYIADVAQTLNNLGLLHKDLTRYDEAKYECNEALKICRELVATNRDAFISILASTLNNMGELYHVLSLYKDAEKILMEALEIRRELVKINRDAYLDNLAETLYNISSLRKDEKRIDEARDAANEALGIHKDLANKYPHIWNKDVEKTQRLLDELMTPNPSSSIV